MPSCFLGRRLVDDVFHVGVLGKNNALLVELVHTDPLQKHLQNLVYTLVFLDQFLILATALDRVSSLDEHCHLLEDF